MKKILLGLGVIAAFCVFLSIPQNVSAARGTTTTCTDDDNNLFPYGFMCGTDPNFAIPAEIGVSVSGVDGSGNVAGGSTVTVTGRWTDPNGHLPKNNNKQVANTLTWITINAKNAVDSTATDALNINSVSSGGNSSLACPGQGYNDDGGFGPGTVFGFRDIGNREYQDGSISNGVNASPVAYNYQTNRGVINCQFHGKMVYWTDSAATSRTYSFNIRTDNVDASNVCVRLDLSIPFTGDSRAFPLSTDARDPHEQNVWASHLVKQSNEACFNVVKQHAANSWGVDMTADCNTLTGHIIKYNGSGQPTNSSNGYILQRWNPGIGAWENVPGAFGSTNGANNSFSASINGAAYFGNGIPNAFRVINSAWPGSRLPNDDTGIILAVPCNEQPTVVQFTATCHSVTFHVLSDGNSPSGRLTIAINAYDRVTGSRAYTQFDNIYQGQTIEFNQPPNQQNEGMDVYAGAFQWHTPGVPSGDYQGGTVPFSGSAFFTTGPCYAATCTLSATSAGMPDGNVEEGKPFTLKATINNTGDGGMNSLYSSVSGTNLTITPDWGNMADNNAVGFTAPRALGQDVPLGGARTGGFNGYAAPNRLGTFKIRGYADYNGRFALRQSFTNPAVAPCEGTVKLRQHFHLDPTATVTPDSDEDPTTIDYSTFLTLKNLSNSNPSLPVRAPTVSSFYKLAVGSVTPQYVNGVPISTSGQFVNGQNYVISPTTYSTTGKPQAGEQYCSEVTNTVFNDGYIGDGGPDDIIQSTPPTSAPGPTDKNCMTVDNRATYKVYGSSVTAGGTFADASGGSCSGGGQLAGWFNNKTGLGVNGTYNWGSSTELSALALMKDVGFASAQAVASRSPTDLTLANTTAKAADTYSPPLGGDYGDAASSNCLTPIFPLAGSHDVPSPSLSIDALPVSRESYKHDGDFTINGGTINPNQQVSIFVKGDVFITSNISYRTTGWNRDNVPSFALHTNGNIYISPNVTQLDGLYVAEPRVNATDPTKLDPGTKSTIYTCGTPFAPISDANRHDACRNQLTVHGSFVADHVNLMRTYGSLRDEKPATTGVDTLPGLTWINNGVINNGGNGDVPQSAVSAKSCVQLFENQDKGPANPGVWNDNYLCVPNSSAVHLLWAYRAFDLGPNDTPGNEYGKPQFNGPSGDPRTNGYCTNLIDPSHPAEDSAGTWGDNWLCSDANIGLQFSIGDKTSATKLCLAMPEPNDPNPNRQTNAFICWNKNLTVTPPGSPLSCSNPGARSSGRNTCAAEVFDFSPEMYLSNQAICETDDCVKSPNFDAITSLPPVL